MIIDLVLRLMYTYVALTLFDYFHILPDCNPIWIHGMPINEMKFLFSATNTRNEYMYCEGNVSIFNCLKRGLHETKSPVTGNNPNYTFLILKNIPGGMGRTPEYNPISQ